MPFHVIGTSTAGAQRDRHLVAADASFSAVDALAGRIGHRYAREGGLELLGEPQRYITWRARDLVADARLGMV
jgi:hypothetical protein